jgi:hypothetical protein
MINDAPGDDVPVPSGGRGRGRGRGSSGVPVLPQGLWEEISGGLGGSGASSSALNEEEPVRGEDFRYDEPDRYEEVVSDDGGNDFMPMSFGRGGAGGGKGRGRGRGGDRGDGAGRGRGFEKDLKGADWTCDSCGNVNWSWRATCNKCQTARPYVPTVSPTTIANTRIHSHNA